MKILAVDFGKKRVGLASGDTSNKIAFPKGVLFRVDDEQVMRELLEVCSEGGYGKVVFGMPENLEGGDQQMKIVKNFIEIFVKISSIEVDTVDESFSSFEADSYLKDFKGEKVRMEEGDRDAMAAKIILERYFETL